MKNEECEVKMEEVDTPGHLESCLKRTSSTVYNQAKAWLKLRHHSEAQRRHLRRSRHDQAHEAGS